jgi:hypothetical protein
LKVTEKEAQASVLQWGAKNPIPSCVEDRLRPYFAIEEQGWGGKFEAGETVELGIVQLIGRPRCLNWGRIPPEGFPPTFSCDNALFWSESDGEVWKGSVLSGEIWVDDPSFLLDWTKNISHFAVFNTPRRDDDHQESTEE